MPYTRPYHIEHFPTECGAHYFTIVTPTGRVLLRSKVLDRAEPPEFMVEYTRRLNSGAVGTKY